MFSSTAFSQINDLFNVKQKGNLDRYKIGITNGSFVPKVASEESYSFSETELFDKKYFRLIQFYELPSDKDIIEFSKKGLELTDYLPGQLYFAVIDESFDIYSIQTKIRSIFPVDYRFKVDNQLFKKLEDASTFFENEKRVVNLYYYNHLSESNIKVELERLGFSIVETRNDVRQINLYENGENLRKLLKLPFIQFIGLEPDSIQLDGNEYRNSTGRSNYVNTGYNGLNYNGAGVVIGVGESGVISSNLEDIKGRYTELETGLFSGHRLEVAELAISSGNMNPSERNNAWGATVLGLGFFPDYSALYGTHNLRYTNHSYGTDTDLGVYNTDARSLDLRIETLPVHMVVYAAGNEGINMGYPPYNELIGWANLSGNYKQNKNHLNIGTLSPIDDLMAFSSRGPLSDGRISPHLVIEGEFGTSFSTPKVTGNLAILNQIYKDKNFGIEPPSSLLRVVLLNTADDMGNPGPDFKYGFGRVNMRRAYNMINENRLLTASVSNSALNTHTIAVPPNTKQVRVMIVWPDKAAATGAIPAIVNNLNLEAISPSAESYKPWVLETTPNVTALDLPAERGIDNINTIEQITIDNPESGAWNFNVTGSSVPFGPQTYYLSYEFLMDEVHITYPLSKEQFSAGSTYHLRWDSYGESGTFDLYYRISGGNWIQIVSGYNANSRVYTWTPPLVSGIQTIEFKVSRGKLSSVSGINYIGGVPENFRIVKICNDTVYFHWSPVSNATGYKVYKLGNQYMEEVTSNITYNGNTATLTNQSTSQIEYYAVSTIMGSIESGRCLTIQKSATSNLRCTEWEWTGTNSSDWFDVANWSQGSLPTCSRSVRISASAINQPIISNTGAACYNLTINPGATLTMSGTTASTLSLCGDWDNNGTFLPGIGTVIFNGAGLYQEIGGSVLTNFYHLTINKTTPSSGIVEAVSPIDLLDNISNVRLELLSGTFKLSNSASNVVAINSNGQSAAPLSSSRRIWVQSGTMTIKSSWRINGGELRISDGIVNIGISSNQSLDYLSNGKLNVQGGNLNVSGGIWGNATTSSGTLNLTGGTITVGTIGNTTSRSSFEFNTNCTFNMSGGRIVICRQGSVNAGSDFYNHANNYKVNGGTIEIGNAITPVNQTIRINSKVPMHNLLLNATNNPIALLTNNELTVNKDVTILGGTLNSNGLSLNLGGDWTNNALYVPNNSTVTFKGFTNQKIQGANMTSFFGLIIDNSEGVTLDDATNVLINGNLIFTNGVFTTGRMP